MAGKLPPPTPEDDDTPEDNRAKRIHIKPPHTALIRVPIRHHTGSPLIVSAFSRTKIEPMAKKMELGSLADVRRKNRDPRDWSADMEAARHVSAEGWDGFAAASVRNACISACKLVGLAMTRAKLSIFVEADGADLDDGTPLCRIYGPAPQQSRMVGRLPTGAPNILIRPLWQQWGAILRIRYDADQFLPDDIGNLLMRVGQQTGLCEGRPDSKRSNGIGAGLFEVLRDENELDDLKALDPTLDNRKRRQA